MTAFVVVLAIRGRTDLGTDHVDGKFPISNSDRNKKVKV